MRGLLFAAIFFAACDVAALGFAACDGDVRLYVDGVEIPPGGSGVVWIGDAIGPSTPAPPLADAGVAAVEDIDAPHHLYCRPEVNPPHIHTCR